MYVCMVYGYPTVIFDVHAGIQAAWNIATNYCMLLPACLCVPY